MALPCSSSALTSISIQGVPPRSRRASGPAETSPPPPPPYSLPPLATVPVRGRTPRSSTTLPAGGAGAPAPAPQKLSVAAVQLASPTHTTRTHQATVPRPPQLAGRAGPPPCRTCSLLLLLQLLLPLPLLLLLLLLSHLRGCRCPLCDRTRHGASAATPHARGIMACPGCVPAPASLAAGGAMWRRDSELADSWQILMEPCPCVPLLRLLACPVMPHTPTHRAPTPFAALHLLGAERWQVRA